MKSRKSSKFQRMVKRYPFFFTLNENLSLNKKYETRFPPHKCFVSPVTYFMLMTLILSEISMFKK